MLISPTANIIIKEKIEMRISVPCGVAGKVKIQTIQPSSNKITGSYEFENIWTDFGLNRIGNGNSSTNTSHPAYVFLGSGRHSEPFNSIRELAKAEQVIQGSGWGGSSSNSVWRDNRVITETHISSHASNIFTGSVLGKAWSLTELGLSNDSSITYKTMDTYALVVDGNGNPSSIEVAADEAVIVTYTLYYKFPLKIQLPSVMIGDIETEVEFIIPTESNQSGGWLTSGPSTATGGTSYPYWLELRTGQNGMGSGVRGNSYESGRPTWGSTLANRANGSLKITGGNLGYFKFTPPILKTNKQKLKFNIFFHFSNIPLS